MARLRTSLSYANVTATLALVAALGGTSYAAIRVTSGDVVDNSLRSRDIRNGTVRSRDVRDRTIRARDIRRNALGSTVIKESALDVVPRAVNADRLAGATAGDLRLRCPTDTVSKAGVCIESSARTPAGFVSAVDQCSRAGRQLISMPELDLYARSTGPLPQPEWTANVYRNSDSSLTPTEQLQTVLVQGFADVGYDRVHSPVQHAFRCVALPSN